VFTLSAITGEEFDGAALKEASFARLPDRTCQTTERLFLICRGNGNRELVGCGKFPLDLTMNTVFPDTMIAAVPNPDRLLPAFLEAAWKQPTTRSQIRSNARTTNGTFKINQTVIEQIRLPVPPLPLQKEFVARVSEIRAMQAEQAASRRRLDDLFHSMLHRAFQGEL
jgi:type I restriction enzyme, S subunit